MSEVIDVKIMHNGSLRDATPEEEAEAARQQTEIEAEEVNREPTFEERMEAQVMYTALMTDTLLMEDDDDV